MEDPGGGPGGSPLSKPPSVGPNAGGSGLSSPPSVVVSAYTFSYPTGPTAIYTTPSTLSHQVQGTSTSSSSGFGSGSDLSTRGSPLYVTLPPGSTPSGPPVYDTSPSSGIQTTPSSSRYAYHTSHQGYTYYGAPASPSPVPYEAPLTPGSASGVGVGPGPSGTQSPWPPSQTSPGGGITVPAPPYRPPESHICVFCRSPIPPQQAQPLSLGSHLCAALENLIGHAFTSLAGHYQHLCPQCVDKLNAYNAAQHQVQQMKDELIILFWSKSKLPMPHSKEDLGARERIKEEAESQDETGMEEQEDGEDWRDFLEDTACKLCAKVFTKLRLAILHVKRRHREHLHYSCSLCGRRFTTSLALLNHTERAHASSTTAEALRGLTSGGVIPHQFIPIKDEEGEGGAFVHMSVSHVEYICSLCDQPFSDKNHLAIHLRDYHGAISSEMPTPPSLGLSPSAMPQDTPSSSYPLTSSAPGTPSYPGTPQEVPPPPPTATHTRSQQYACNICGRRFASRTQLIRDHLPLHKEGHDQICSVCNKGFKGVPKLKEHLAVVHSDIKKHICSYCGKEYARAKSLKEHEFAHRGEKPYGCKYCDYRTNISSNVYIHMRNKHKRERQQVAAAAAAAATSAPSMMMTLPAPPPSTAPPPPAQPPPPPGIPPAASTAGNNSGVHL